MCANSGQFFGIGLILISVLSATMPVRSPPQTLQDPAYGSHGFMKVNGVRLHYVENGDRQNPLMLLLHGEPEFWYTWRKQLQYFAKTHWVVAPDLRGFGDSERPPKISDYKYETLQKDVVQLIKGLGKNSSVLVGHYWGGVIAYGVAANYPNLVSKLVILNAPHPNAWLRSSQASSMTQFIKSSWFMAAFQMPFVLEAGSSTGLRVVPPGFFRIPGVSKWVPPLHNPEELQAYKYAYRSYASWRAMLNYSRAYLRYYFFGQNNLLPKITKIPTLIIWGDGDIFFDSKMPELSRRYVTNLRIEHIPNATHYVINTKGDEVNRLIESFL